MLCDSVAASHQEICCSVNQVYPLSLLAFAAAAKVLSLPRHPQSSCCQQQQYTSSAGVPSNNIHGTATTTTGGSIQGLCSQVQGIEHRYRRHVKPKKQHEIKCLAEVGTQWTCCLIVMILCVCVCVCVLEYPGHF